ncbi:hypothetical protein FACS1894184_15270 [Clostridia bacterium]|nr:hypothetical protein FACS1894184_15270 [Clostridia bacterium]
MSILGEQLSESDLLLSSVSDSSSLQGLEVFHGSQYTNGEFDVLASVETTSTYDNVLFGIVVTIKNVFDRVIHILDVTMGMERVCIQQSGLTRSQ